MRIKFDIHQAHCIDPPLRFEDGVQVHPSTGKMLTKKQLQGLAKKREENQIVQYYVNFWTQPFRDRLIWKLYHAYDMAVVKIPGIYRFENWLYGKKDRNAGEPFALSWFMNQDYHCYRLSMKNRINIATVEIDEELYKELEKRVEDL